jgi:peptide-methionine (S)-S-oxide reductase
MTMAQIPAAVLLAALLAAASPLATQAADAPAASGSAAPTLATAVFAGGCFWCMEPPYDKLDGVVSTISGYTGGHTQSPTYEQVSDGGTGHYEAVQITYDPAKVGYEKLLDVFWHNVDPLDASGQFCDKGTQYRAAIFYAGPEQQRLAQESKEALDKSGRLPKPIVTEILPTATFYPAEEYHQDYYQKNPIRYHFYRFNCGRDQRLDAVWGDKRSS